MRSQDRADVTFLVNELCQNVSNPTQKSLAKLKRPVRYLKCERQWEQVFSYGRMAEEVAAGVCVAQASCDILFVPWSVW